MPVLMVVVIVVVFAVVVYVATGRGGQMSVERGDYVPLDLGPVSATDVALMRPPSAMWGYNIPATDAAMEQIAESIRERDVRIVALEQLVTDLSRDHVPALPLGSPYVGARHRRAQGDAPDVPGPAVQTGGQPNLYGPADPVAGPAAYAAQGAGYAAPGPAYAASDPAYAASETAEADPWAAAGAPRLGDAAAAHDDAAAEPAYVPSRGPELPPWEAAAEGGDPPATQDSSAGTGLAGIGLAETEPARSVTADPVAAEPVRLDVDPARPGSDQPGPPPERSHD